METHNTEDLIRKILEAKASGLNKLEISKLLGISRNTVIKYFDRDVTTLTSEEAELGTALKEKKFDAGAVRRLGTTVVQRFLFHPHRITAILQHFYQQSFKDSRILIKYMDYIMPQQQNAGGVYVQVNTSISKDMEKQRDVEGNIIDPTIVRESDSSRDDPAGS